jgi:hypothetical protein
VIERLPVGAAVLVAVLAIGACSTGDGAPVVANRISVGDARAAAAEAAPAQCPLGVDVPGLLADAGVEATAEFDEAAATVAKTDEPAEDPIAAERGGMSAVDATAGAEIECHYTAGDAEFDVYVVVTRSKGAVNLLAPLVVREAHMTPSELEKVLVPSPEPGDVTIVSDNVALGALPADGGDAAMMVCSTVRGIGGDELGDVHEDLALRLKP